MSNIKIAIFASGNGTNAEAIAKYFEKKDGVEITMIISNKKDAFVLERAKKMNIPAFVFSAKDFQNPEKVFKLLQDNKIDFIILAGFLLLLPDFIVDAYPCKIVNIHPALLPKYGGKGMYGMAVHDAVIANKEKESGITIHYVNKNYDEGQIIFQAKCLIEDNDTSEILASKVHELEYKYFPQIIEKTIKGKYH